MVPGAAFGGAAEPRYVGFDEECGDGGQEASGFEPWFGSEEGISTGERDAKRCYPPDAVGSHHAARMMGAWLPVGGVFASVVPTFFLGLRRGRSW